MTKRKSLTVYLDPENHAYLSQLATAQGTSMSGMLRRLLREMRQMEAGADDVTMPEPHRSGFVIAESSVPYFATDLPHGTASGQRRESSPGREAVHDQALLRRLIVDIANDQDQRDNISLGDMLDQSRQRWTTATNAEENLLEALLADRAEDRP